MDGRLLVVGCGNSLAGDDAAGVEVVSRLLARGGDPARHLLLPHLGVEFLDCIAPKQKRVRALDGAGAGAVLFIDAVRSGAAPGAVHFFRADSAEFEARPMAALSAHGWSLGEMLKLARALGRPLPAVFVLGIEAGDVTPGAPRSAAVERAIESVVARFPELQARLTRGAAL